MNDAAIDTETPEVKPVQFFGGGDINAAAGVVKDFRPNVTKVPQPPSGAAIVHSFTAPVDELDGNSLDDQTLPAEDDPEAGDDSPSTPDGQPVTDAPETIENLFGDEVIDPDTAPETRMESTDQEVHTNDS